LLVLAVWAVGWLDEARPRPATGSRLTSGQRVAAWLVVLAVLVISAAVIGASGLRAGLPTEEVAVGVVTGSMSVTAATAICFCLVWQVDARLDRRARQSPAEGAQRGPG
jgi:heme A synthase